MLVTLHIPPGCSIKQLIGEIAELSGGVRPRTVSGRVGVLVDAQMAYRYLAARYAPPAPTPASPPPAPAPVVVPAPPPVPAPKKVVPTKRSTKPAAPKGE